MDRLVWATKSEAERQEEEAERLVRPSPKQKPPRRDLRRERVRTDQDPEDKPDKDTSHNYKDIGGSVRLGKGRNIPVVNEKGELVPGGVSPETFKKTPGRYKRITPEDAAKLEAQKAKKPDESEDEAAKWQEADEDTDEDTDEDEDEGPDLISTIAQSLLKALGMDDIADTLTKQREEEQAKAKKEKAKEKAKAKKEKAKKEKAQKAESMGGVQPEIETETADTESETADTETETADAKSEEAGAKSEEAGAKSEEAGAEEKPQTEAEKAGIQAPTRPEPSEADQQAAQAVAREVFPGEVGEKLLASGMHPNDIRDMAINYRAAMEQSVGTDPAKFAAKVRGNFYTDPDQVPLPEKGINKDGKEVPFDELDDNEKAVVYRRHQVEVVSASLAAQEQLTTEMQMPSLTGKPRIPRGLAANLASFMLTSPSKEELGELQMAADKGDKRAAKALQEYQETTSALVSGTFEGTLEAGEHIPIKDSVAKKMLRALDNSPGGREMAAAFLQANDYTEAKDKFLKGEEGVTEYDSPRAIMSGLSKANKWFADRAKVYGTDGHAASSMFQERVLNKLAALEPEKYYEVRSRIDHKEAADFDKAEARYKQEHKAWSEKKRKFEEGQSFGGYGVVAPGAKATDFEEPEPQPPNKPIRYGMGKDPNTLRSMGKSLYKKLFDRTKTAAANYVSTYPRGSTMDQPNKTGVYHGIDPAENDAGPYPDHSPAVLGPAEYETLLVSARGWLKDPAAGQVPGEQKYRAALDLAIKSAGYDKQVDPGLYNQLLAEFAGRAVQAGDSSCSPSSSSKVCPMKAAQEIRRMAAKTASTNPKLAYELSDLADRLTDDRYTQIRSLIIRTAASDERAKRVLLPVLRAIKAMG